MKNRKSLSGIKNIDKMLLYLLNELYFLDWDEEPIEERAERALFITQHPHAAAICAAEMSGKVADVHAFLLARYKRRKKPVSKLRVIKGGRA